MENDQPLFRKESLKNVDSSHQMDSYIVVIRPLWWVLVVAMVVILLSISLWANIGNIPETVSTKALVLDATHLVCFLPSNGKNQELIGKPALVKFPDSDSPMVKANVERVESIPYSRREVAQELPRDWLIDNLITSDYVDKVYITTEKPLPLDGSSLCNVIITENQVKLIRYILN